MQKHWKYILLMQFTLVCYSHAELTATDDGYLLESEEADGDLSLEDALNDSYPPDEGAPQPPAKPVNVVTPRSNTDLKYTFFGEMLYLRPYFQGMESFDAINTSQFPSLTSSTTTSQVRQDNIKVFDWDFNFGFRLGFQFKTHWLNMESELIWMRFHASHTKHLPLAVVSNSTAFLYDLEYEPYWNRSISEPCGQGYDVSYHTKLNWDQIDLLSKFPLHPLQRFTIAPKLGIRGLISQVRLKLNDIKDGIGCYGPIITSGPLNTQTSKLYQRYHAIGLLTGFDTDTNLGWGFHFDTLFNAALVFGNMHTKNIGSKIESVVPPNSFPVVYSSQTNFYMLKPVFDVQLLLSWKRNFFSDKMGLDIYAGYEVHFIPNYLQALRLVDSGDQVQEYDLSMQGFVVGMGISF